VRGDGGRSHILATDEELSSRHIGVFEVLIQRFLPCRRGAAVRRSLP
jgi:hypothetical protein